MFLPTPKETNIISEKKKDFLKKKTMSHERLIKERELLILKYTKSCF